MIGNTEQYVLEVMSGAKRGVGPSLLRAAMAIAEPFYASAMSLRNMRYARQWGVRHLPRPVISVGNLTAGGTGKTPIVRWLCERLLHCGLHPAVLTRGFRSADEPRMLESFFGSESGKPKLLIAVNSDRFAGGQRLLVEHPEIDVFVMDDGFQHRRLHRNFNLVLVNAAQPFGFGHVHPRGLLRESLSGFRRADAVLITRANALPREGLAAIDQKIRTFAPAVPIFHCSHKLDGLRSSRVTAGQPYDMPLAALAGKRIVTLCGLGDPQSFEHQIFEAAGPLILSIRLGDHRRPTESQMAELRRLTSAQADYVVTTEKDWQNLRAANLNLQLPLFRADLRIEFAGDNGRNLLDHVRQRIVLSENKKGCTAEG